MNIKLISICLFINGFLFAQDITYESEAISINEYIEGSLLSPKAIDKPNLVIIIAGSGPIDRDGNQNFQKSNVLKKLAIGLTERDIATFRYDKRIVKQIRKGRVDPDISFDDFISDAQSIISYFKTTNKFNKIFIAGHSQGSLVGLIAAKDQIDGFISLAGAGRSIDKVIMEQIAQMDSSLIAAAQKVFDILKSGKSTDEYPQALSSIFNKEVQDFIANWMSYDPVEEIKKLKMPILIINGTKDLQVSESEAKRLKDAVPKAELKIIESMNHMLVTIEGGDLENSKSYNESFRPLAPKLLEAIVRFVKS